MMDLKWPMWALDGTLCNLGISVTGMPRGGSNELWLEEDCGYCGMEEVSAHIQNGYFYA